MTSLLFFSFHTYPNSCPSPAQFYFPVVTEKGRRSCLLMAPGACGSRLANQCESTSGTSLGQTIYQRTLSLLSDSRPFLSGSQAGRHPLGGSARSHIGETFPKAFPVLLASRQAVTFLPSCVFHKHTRGPKGTGGQHCPFVDMLDWGWGRRDSFRSRHWCGPACLCNLWWLFDCIPSRTLMFLMRFNRLPGLNRAT